MANHFKGAEGVGGWLYLTKDELIFKSHNINIQNHKLAMPLNQIASVKTSFSLGFIPNGLQVVTNDGVEKFVVFNRKEWVYKINASIN